MRAHVNPTTARRQYPGGHVVVLPGEQMVVEIRRYLGNTLSAHIHDADHEHPNCHLGRISREPALVRLPGGREEARSDMGYDGAPGAWADQTTAGPLGRHLHDPRTLTTASSYANATRIWVAAGGYREPLAALRDAI